MIDTFRKLTALFRVLPVLLFLCCLSTPSWSDNFDEQIGSMILLEQKSVQKEIALTTAQRSRMNVFADAHRARLNAYYAQLYKDHEQHIPESGQKMLLGWFAELKTKVFAVLRPDQLKRLREISLQALGFPALGDAVIAERVGLNSAQQTKIRSILKAAKGEAASVQEKAVDVATADLQKQKPKTNAEKKALSEKANKRAQIALDNAEPQVDRIRTRAKDQVMAALTPGERATWEGLLGKPFKP